MADSLRTRLIRLAAEREDLRPHLLPMLRTSYVVTPRDWVDFAFEGPDKEARGLVLATAAQRAVEEVREVMKTQVGIVCRQLAACKSVDKVPDISRHYLEQMFVSLMEEQAKEAVKRIKQV